jgi:hypothetical protein
VQPSFVFAFSVRDMAAQRRPVKGKRFAYLLRII